MIKRRQLLTAAAVVGLNIGLALLVLRPSLSAPQPRHVLHISVDGLGSAQFAALLNAKKLPNFERLLREGASTLNARTDVDFTVTLPNHTAMLTGRPVRGPAGHGYEENGSPAEDKTLHNNADRYIASAFDVAHDNGLRTALYASKSKFVVYDASFDAASGAQDTTGIDDGRDKIDVYHNMLDTDALVKLLIRNMTKQPAHYTFLHLNDPDRAGHANGWGSPPYVKAVLAVDAKLGRILAMIDNSKTLKDNTWIVLSSDHGGIGIGHGDARNEVNYTIPLIVWAPNGVARGDLYALNPRSCANPGVKQIAFDAKTQQPLRNGDTGNCALRILGLPPIPGSTLNALQAPCGP